MSTTKPTAQTPPLSSEETTQLLHLVQDCSNNLRHAKTQQWLAGHFTILAYAGIVAAYDLAFHPKGYSHVFMAIGSVMTLVACGTGLCMVWDLQIWMARLRRPLSKAETHFSCRYQEIVGSLHDDRSYRSVFYRSLQTWLITLVMALGWLVASAIIVMRSVPR